MGVESERIEKKIKRVMTRFVEKNKFPSYDEILHKIEYNGEDTSNFSKLMYIITKRIYENPENKEEIIKMGKIITKMGGLKMLSLCNLVLTFVYDKSNKEIVYTYGRRIEFILSEGIPDYQA